MAKNKGITTADAPHQVTSVHRTGYTVKINDVPQFCITNNSFKGDDKPVVGDFVKVEKIGDQFLIIQVAKRRSYIARYDHYKDKYQGFASNVDAVLVVTSANREFSPHRIRRFLALCGDQPVRKMIILTKMDICEDPEFYTSTIKREFPGVEFIKLSTLDEGQVIGMVRENFKNSETVLLVGSSGVGKSTMINTLCKLNLKTLEVQGERLGNRGKHTTSARNLYQSEYGIKIIDIPGVRIVGVEENVARSSEIFEKIEELAFNCKYTNCKHDTEDKCMVKKAIADGELKQEELENYRRTIYSADR